MALGGAVALLCRRRGGRRGKRRIGLCRVRQRLQLLEAVLKRLALNQRAIEDRVHHIVQNPLGEVWTVLGILNQKRCEALIVLHGERAVGEEFHLGLMQQRSKELGAELEVQGRWSHLWGAVVSLGRALNFAEKVAEYVQTPAQSPQESVSA